MTRAILGFLAGLALGLGILGVSTAHGATAQRETAPVNRGGRLDPQYPLAAEVRRAMGSALESQHSVSGPQQRTDAVAQWMSETLLIPVPSRTTLITSALYRETSDAEFWPSDGSIRIRPEFDAGAIGVYVRIHESLHKADTALYCPGQEEAIVDALARDLLPALLKRMGYAPAIVHTAYDTRGPNGEASVGDVRAASAVATGEPWTSRSARLFRRALWAADCATRSQMLNPQGGTHG